jgi:hypothetical protein
MHMHMWPLLMEFTITILRDTLARQMLPLVHLVVCMAAADPEASDTHAHTQMGEGSKTAGVFAVYDSNGKAKYINYSRDVVATLKGQSPISRDPTLSIQSISPSK